MAVHYHHGKFPPRELDWPRLIPHLGPAAAAVARFDGLLSAVPNADVLLSPMTTQEAVLSSRIEGTQATMGEVLEFEAEDDIPSKTVPPERRDDIQEVQNYRKAMFQAESLLKTLPLSRRVIRDLHKTLLSGVRGEGKAPGDYRRIAHWIGPAGCTAEKARFVPISAEKLPQAMSGWERYMHADGMDRLVQLGILHAEFEALHPFLDGNGRLGRMLVPLFLWQNGLLKRPMFYVSAFFDANRDEYYQRLLAVSESDDWTSWCEFFLRAIQEQAEANQTKATAILDLYGRMKQRVVEVTHSQYAILALDWVFGRPIFRSTLFVSRAGIPEPTAKRILSVFRGEGLLKAVVEGRGRRASVYSFPELLNLAEGRNVF